MAETSINTAWIPFFVAVLLGRAESDQFAWVLEKVYVVQGEVLQLSSEDQADEAEQITLWEYLRRAAEKSSCQEGHATEQRSPFWGIRLAGPLPGTGLLRCGPAHASSAYRRQHLRQIAPVPDSVAGRCDAPTSCSTGGPHDSATPGYGARSSPLSGFTLAERPALVCSSSGQARHAHSSFASALFCSDSGRALLVLSSSC
ncbi:hypothetical protein CRENBAI_000918 [Crenichthys baileyi]|uniref:Uncharacterized protein n=1 Tax=Crenichthys baileyi TaxID=28760 RepID=A0AAV9RHC4_9TELE